MLGVTGQTKVVNKRNESSRGGKSLPAIVSVQKSKVATKNVEKNTVPKTKAVKKPTAISVKHNEAVEQVHDCKKNILEVAKVLLGLPANSTEGCGAVKVRFNHYNKSFPIHNGVLKWSDIDEEYCISFVYRGNFIRNLILTSVCGGTLETTDNNEYAAFTDEHGRRVTVHDESYSYFIGLQDKQECTLEVIEDAVAGIGAEGLRLNAGPLCSAQLNSIQPSNSESIKNTNRAFDTITSELKSIAVTDLDGAHAKDLIERRDLEDILYSG